MADCPIAGSHLLELPDGRRLEYEVSGPDGGPALVYHHGTPGSCRPLGALATSVHARGLRLVTSSRAGYGRSTRRAGRRVVDVVDDTEHLLDALDIDRCLVAGWSGGGPHALACAARLTGRVRGVLVVAGVAPANGAGLDFLAGMGEANLEEFGHAQAGEEPLRASLEGEQEVFATVSGDDLAQGLESLLSDADRQALAEGMAEDLAAQIRHGVADSVEGWVDDDLAFLADWGFSVDEIGVPTSLWQGGEDLMVPLAHGQWLAGRIPGVVAHLEAGEGHISLPARLPDRMLDELLALSR